MRALVCTEYGPAEKLVIEELPDLQPKPGEVLVDVKAAGINFPDNLMIQGLYQVKVPPPFVPGNEASGVIAAVGENVQGLKVGDRVIVLPQGGAFAEQCRVPAEMVLPMPADMSFEQAAGFSITYATSYHAFKQSAALKAGETVLVLGAAGGVGSTAVELAKSMGATVIAAASSAEKCEYARQMGADHLINYSEQSLRDEVKALTEGRGVDVVYDPVGGELAQQALRATAWQGRYLVVGFACGQIPDFPANLALLKEASIIGVWWGTWAARNPGDSQQNFSDLMLMAAKGQLKLSVTETFPLDDYVDAFAEITTRRARGKVILTIA
jgi:NADPH2:quinone reductase